MYQEEYIKKMKELEERKEALRNTLKDFGQQYVGKNLQDIIPELAKNFLKISIYRNNVTLKVYHSRRTKGDKWDINHGCRLNTIPINENTILYDEFNATIKKVDLDNCTIFEEEGKYYTTDTLRFILDDSEEYIIIQEI